MVLGREQLVCFLVDAFCFGWLVLAKIEWEGGKFVNQFCGLRESDSCGIHGCR